MADTILKIQAPNEYAGKQAIITSDRLVFNARLGDLILSARNTIALSANNEIHINSAGNMYLNAKDGSKITIGKSGTKTRKSEQPAILGNNQTELLEDLLDLLLTFQVVTPNGEGQAGPDVAAKVSQLRAKYLTEGTSSYILSDLLFIADNIK